VWQRGGDGSARRPIGGRGNHFFYRGRFVKLVTNEQVVEVVELETTDPALGGEMTITITLPEAGGARRAR
jgi:hypothetical protein